MRFSHAAAVASLMTIVACDESEPPPAGRAQILVIGDSIMRWNADRAASVADAIARALDEPVWNASVAGARMRIQNDPEAGGYVIRNQYQQSNWRWVVMNGGANDLANECGCDDCDRVLDSMIDVQGQSGEIPALVRKMTANGAKVIATGYFEAFGANTEFSACKDEFAELDARLGLMADTSTDVHFVATSSVIAPASGSDYAIDGIHPSTSGSRKIGEAVAGVIASNE